MDEDLLNQILDEIRNQTAMAKKYSKQSKWISGIFVIVIILLISIPIMIPRIHHVIFPTKTCSQPVDSWTEAKSLLDRQEMKKAEEMTQRLIKNYPNYYWGYH